MCEDAEGQLHHRKATNRIGSTLISLSGVSLAGLRADFLVGDAPECRVQ